MFKKHSVRIWAETAWFIIVSAVGSCEQGGLVKAGNCSKCRRTVSFRLTALTCIITQLESIYTKNATKTLLSRWNLNGFN